MNVWEPDDGYRHGQLRNAELRWLAGKAQETPDPEDVETVPDEHDRDKEPACD